MRAMHHSRERDAETVRKGPCFPAEAKALLTMNGGWRGMDKTPDKFDPFFRV